MSTLALISHLEKVYDVASVEQRSVAVGKFNRDELEAMVLYLVGERLTVAEKLGDMVARVEATAADLLVLADSLTEPEPEEAVSG